MNFYILGLSVNYFNSSILATTATDGNIILWDLKSTENPIFQKKSYSPSDCTWIQQCHTLIYCCKCVKYVDNKSKIRYLCIISTTIIWQYIFMFYTL